MKLWKKLAIGACVVVLAAVVGLVLMIYLSMRPTTGPRIAAYPSAKTALLVIDVQEDYTGPHAKKPYRDGQRIIAASNALLSRAETKGILVVYIQNVIEDPLASFLMGGVNAPGAPGTEMDRRLVKVPGARTFTKHRSDAFSTRELDDYLRAQQVDHLLITGLDAAYCVNATVRGALNRGYKVTVYSEGIATESRTPVGKLVEDWRTRGAEVKAGTEM